MNKWHLKILLIAVIGLFILTALPQVVTAVGNQVITGISIHDVAGKVGIKIAASGPVSFRTYMSKEPRKSLIVDISPATLGKNVKTRVELNKGMVERVRAQQLSAGKVRVTVDLVDNPIFIVTQAPGGFGVNVDIGIMPRKPVAKVSAVKDEPPAPPKAAPKPRKVKKAAPKKELVSLDFVGADIVYVLKLLAKQSGANIVADNTVKGTVTMTLNNVPLETALALICKTSGFDYKKEGNVLLVGSAENLAKITPRDMVPRGEEIVDVVVLQYASAADMEKVLKQQYPALTITMDAGINAIILKGSATLVKEAKEMVTAQDVEKQVAAVKTTLIQLKYAQAKDIESQIKAQVPEASNLKVDERTNGFIIQGSDDEIAKVKKYLDLVDIPLKQVVIECRIIDLSETDAKELGIDWVDILSFSGASGTVPTFTEQVAGAAAGASAPTAINTLSVDGFTRLPFLIGGPAGKTFNMKLEKKNAKTIAYPKIATQSGKEAKVHIGTQYQILYYDSRAGTYSAISVNTGSDLTVTPVIMSDNTIEASINMESTDFKALIANQYPWTGTKKASVKVRMKDGQTLVIGGLINDNKNSTINRVPLLSDIPILGKMFTYWKEQKVYKQLIVLVTPRILEIE